jgi:hypothetical protein
MVNFFSFDGEKHQWDSILREASDCNVFQSFNWGEYKRELGWIPYRFLGKNRGGEVCCLIQVLVKKLPFGYSMGWAAGGPVLNFRRGGNDAVADILKSLADYFSLNFPKMLLRIHSHLDDCSIYSYQLRRCFKRPFAKINSGFTIKIDLDSEELDFSKIMSSKHRYYEKKSRSSEIEWIFGVGDANISALLEVHNQMVERKKIASFAISEEGLIQLRNYFGDNGLTLLTGFFNGRPVTSCLTYDFCDHSIYMVAATNDLGRDICAAYSMIPNLLRHLSAKGIKKFDFGGIDPGNVAAEGVDHFKKGFGGSIIEYLGEWEIAPSELVRIGMNLGLVKRGGRI